MFYSEDCLQAKDLREGHIILFDGGYHVVHKTHRWVNEVDVYINAIDSLTSSTRIELISLPAELFVVTFNFPNKMK